MSTGLEKLVSYGLRTLTWKLEKEICPTDNLEQVIHGLLTVCSVSIAIDLKKCSPFDVDWRIHLSQRWQMHINGKEVKL